MLVLSSYYFSAAKTNRLLGYKQAYNEVFKLTSFKKG